MLDWFDWIDSEAEARRIVLYALPYGLGAVVFGEVLIANLVAYARRPREPQVDGQMLAVAAITGYLLWLTLIYASVADFRSDWGDVLRALVGFGSLYALPRTTQYMIRVCRYELRYWRSHPPLLWTHYRHRWRAWRNRKGGTRA